MSGPLRNVITVALCGACLCVTSPCRADDAVDAAALVRQGAELFARGNKLAPDRPAEARAAFAAAAGRLEAAAASGAGGGKLRYNMGNAYLQAGELGRAILNYRRAERTLGAEANLRRSMALARRMRLDRIGAPASSSGLRTLMFWHYDVGRGVRTGLFALCYVLLWGLAAWRLRGRRGGIAWALGICAVLSALLGGSLLADSDLFDSGRLEGVIVAAEAVARPSDSDEGAIILDGPLHAGTEFTLVELRGEAMHIELVDGRRCWIATDAGAMVRE